MMNLKNNKAENCEFMVPNDANGQAFIEMLRANLNRSHFTIRVRGRGKRTNLPNGRSYPFGSVPLKYAQWLGIYIEGKAVEKVRKSYLQSTYADKETTQKQVRQATKTLLATLPPFYQKNPHLL